jgi:hypothetical protein
MLSLFSPIDSRGFRRCADVHRAQSHKVSKYVIVEPQEANKRKIREDWLVLGIQKIARKSHASTGLNGGVGL